MPPKSSAKREVKEKPAKKVATPKPKKEVAPKYLSLGERRTLLKRMMKMTDKEGNTRYKNASQLRAGLAERGVTVSLVAVLDDYRTINTMAKHGMRGNRIMVRCRRDTQLKPLVPNKADGGKTYC